MAAIPGAAGTGAKYPQWSYDTITHRVAEVPDEVAKTAAEVSTFPDKLIFFTSEQAADAYANSQGGGVDTSSSPLQKAVNAGSETGQAAADAATGNWSALIKGFSGTNFVLRALKIITGGVLLITGLVHMTGMSGPAAQIIRKVPLPV